MKVKEKKRKNIHGKNKKKHKPIKNNHSEVHVVNVRPLEGTVPQSTHEALHNRFVDLLAEVRLIAEVTESTRTGGGKKAHELAVAAIAKANEQE